MQCGWCSVLTALMRRAMCVGSRRGSGDSYYRDLQDPDTVRLHVAAEFSDHPAVESPCVPDGIRYEGVEHFIDSSPESESLCYRSQPRKLDRFHTLHKRRRKRLKPLQDCCFLDAALHGQVQFMLSKAALWRFNMFSLDNTSGGRSIPALCVHLFHHYDLFTHFRLDRVAVWKLFSLIEEGYRAENPYHNATHAADVTQAMHCFMQQSQILAHLEPVDKLACIVAAVAHDVEHPGLNQAFLVHQRSHLALLYREHSVLENHHWRAAMSCLAQSGVLGQVRGRGMRARLQTTVRDLVLATDISRQQEFLTHFKFYLDENVLNLTRREDRLFVLQIALKCADISNPCRIWPISRLWSLSVCEEFYLQGDLEKRMKYPVTSIFDRQTASIPRIQAGFLRFVVTPLVREWHRFLRSDLSLEMLENLRYNLNRWDGWVEKENAGENIELSSKEIDISSLHSFSIRLNIFFSSYKWMSKRNRFVNKLRENVEDNHVNAVVSPDAQTGAASLNLWTNHKNDKLLLSPDRPNSDIFEKEELNEYCNAKVATNENVNEKKKTADPAPVEQIDYGQSNDVTISFVPQKIFPPDDMRIETQPTLRSVDGRILSAYDNSANVKDKNKSGVNHILSLLKASDGGAALKKYSKDKPEWYSLRRRLMIRRESAPVGSQLKDNITSVPLALSPPRRSSEPSVDLKNGDSKLIGAWREKAVPGVGARRGSAPVLGSLAPAPALQRPRRRHQAGDAHVTHRRSSLPDHTHEDSDTLTNI